MTCDLSDVCLWEQAGKPTIQLAPIIAAAIPFAHQFQRWQKINEGKEGGRKRGCTCNFLR